MSAPSSCATFDYEAHGVWASGWEIRVIIFTPRANSPTGTRLTCCCSGDRMLPSCGSGNSSGRAPVYPSAMPGSERPPLHYTWQCLSRRPRRHGGVGASDVHLPPSVRQAHETVLATLRISTKVLTLLSKHVLEPMRQRQRVKKLSPRQESMAFRPRSSN
jgi:hypothetical protein